MALAWIAWRDFEAVMDWDNDFRGQCWIWKPIKSRRQINGNAVGPVLDGWAPEHLEPASAQNFLRLGWIGDNEQLLPGDAPMKAKVELWRALQAAKLEGYGIPTNGEPRKLIPALEWQDLEIGKDYLGRECLRSERGIERYTAVNFGRDAILAVFKPEASKASIKTTAGAQSRCQDWLKTQMEVSPNEKPKSKATFQAEARTCFSVGRRAFDRAWANAASAAGATAWTRGGRPRNLRTKNPRTNKNHVAY